MKAHRALRVGLALALLVAAAWSPALWRAPSSADAQTTGVLLSNLGQDRTNQAGISSGLAQPFRTGANSEGYTLTSIEIATNFDATNTTGQMPGVQVRSGSPTGTVVATLSRLSAPPADGVLQYGAPADTTLAASTTYWVVVTDADITISTYDGRWLMATGDSLDDGSATGWSLPGKGQGGGFTAGGSFGEYSQNIYFKLRVNGYANVADQAGTVSLSTNAPQLDTAVTASLTDPDGGVSGITWQWSSSDSVSGPFVDISGATSASFTPVSRQWGKYLRATASYSDDHGPDKTAHKVADNQVGVDILTLASLIQASAERVAQLAVLGVLVSNSGETSAGGHSVAADELLAVSFTTGANHGGYYMSSVSLEASFSGTAVVTVALYDDSSGSPGTSQATLTRAATSSFFTAAGVVLAASTTYWVVLDNGTAGSVSVSQTASDDQTGEAGWGIGDTFWNKVGTGAWTAAANGNTLQIKVRGGAINSAPVFAAERVARSVAENTYLGYLGGVVGPNTFSGNVGAAVAARDPDGDRLSYSVVATSGSGGAAHLAAFNEDFALNARTGQVSVKAGALIDFEDRSSYKVTVRVSDGKDRVGVADGAVDDTVELTVTVTDVADERPHTTRLLQVSSAGSDCIWSPGEKVVVTVNFNEAVTVDTTGGTPSLTLHLATRKPGEFVL